MGPQGPWVDWLMRGYELRLRQSDGLSQVRSLAGQPTA